MCYNSYVGIYICTYLINRLKCVYMLCEVLLSTKTNSFLAIFSFRKENKTIYVLRCHLVSRSVDL